MRTHTLCLYVVSSAGSRPALPSAAAAIGAVGELSNYNTLDWEHPLLRRALSYLLLRFGRLLCWSLLLSDCSASLPLLADEGRFVFCSVRLEFLFYFGGWLSMKRANTFIFV